VRQREATSRIGSHETSCRQASLLGSAALGVSEGVLRCRQTKTSNASPVPRTRNRWLPGVKWTVRKAVSLKTMRVTWADDTSVELYFAAKASDKSQVAIQHTKLATKSEATQAKKYWGERLAELSQVLLRTQKT